MEGDGGRVMGEDARAATIPNPEPVWLSEEDIEPVIADLAGVHHHNGPLVENVTAVLMDLVAEIALLRQALVFADGACVVGNGYGLADLYNETTPFQDVLSRAGCHPRGREHSGGGSHPSGDRAVAHPLSSALDDVERLRGALAYIAYGNAGLNAEQARLHAAEALESGSLDTSDGR